MLTARYGLQPMLVLQSEFTSCPAMPKSHSFISPFLLIKMLEGFTSGVCVRRGGMCISW